MIRIKNVLVATDFSEPSTVALEYGRELARTYGAKLHVLHIAEDLRWRYATAMTPPVLVDVQDDLETSLRSRLDALITDDDLIVETTAPRDSHYTPGSAWNPANSGPAQDEQPQVPSVDGTIGDERRRGAAAVESVRHILKPRSIVVIGASRNPQDVGNRIL